MFPGRPEVETLVGALRSRGREPVARVANEAADHDAGVLRLEQWLAWLDDE